MDNSDTHEVEEVQQYLDRPCTPSGLREQWETTLEATSLPDFVGDRTVHSITTCQVYMAVPDARRCGWELGGIALHIVVPLLFVHLLLTSLIVCRCTGNITWQHSVC
jgi:hypothetical protein